VLPTLCEGLAHVIPEALSRGLPVLTTPHSGADDFIASGVNGWIVPIRDPDALADRIMWALDHPTDLAAMREAALQTAASRTHAGAVASHVALLFEFANQSAPVHA